MTDRITDYLSSLNEAVSGTTATDGEGKPLPLQQAIGWIVDTAIRTHDSGGTVMLIGNGGSSGICSHIATDLSKCVGIRAACFTDAGTLTCLANDYGYEHVFAKQIEMHARQNDLLIAISSSGRSPNILKGVGAGRDRGCRVVTLSGYDADNPLRSMGDINLHVGSSRYGFVEVAHLGLLHAVVDFKAGWPSTL